MAKGQYDPQERLKMELGAGGRAAQVGVVILLSLASPWDRLLPTDRLAMPIQMDEGYREGIGNPYSRLWFLSSLPHYKGGKLVPRFFEGYPSAASHMEN